MMRVVRARVVYYDADDGLEICVYVLYVRGSVFLCAASKSSIIEKGTRAVTSSMRCTARNDFIVEARQTKKERE